MICTKENRLKNTEKAIKIVQAMTLDEKLRLMGGKRSLLQAGTDFMGKGYNHIPYPAGGCKRMNIPEMLFCDGPRGVVSYHSTCFPVAMARGATFDPELEERVGDVIGKEVRGSGGNFFGGVCLNIPYHPGWGRSQEVYGEDPHHMGVMGAALIRGVQKHNVIACIKHYAFNSMENSRFSVNVIADKRTEREVYLPHFKKCIDAGAASVMSAYNKYLGEHCGHNKYLLRDVLKREWDFDGFVVSDFIFGLKDSEGGITGGLDIEMCNTNHYKPSKLKKLLKNGKITEQQIDEAAVRIVRTMWSFTEAIDPMTYSRELNGCSEHVTLAREVAEKSITLLKNDNILPFDPLEIKKIVILGDLAKEENIGDHGSSRVRPSHVITMPQALEKLYPEISAEFISIDDAVRNKDTIAAADAVVVFAGYMHKDEGEFLDKKAGTGGDRRELGLKSAEKDLIKFAAGLNKNTAVCLIGGNMILVNEWINEVPALLMAFYPGMEGGYALADVLFGKVNPEGKLPYVTVKNASDLPSVDFNNEGEQKYEYYHGYKKTDKEKKTVEFPYGFGLSYTSFSLSDVKLEAVDNAKASFSVKIKNIGNHKGAEVVQLYIGMKESRVHRPPKSLRDFKKIEVNVNEERSVMLEVKLEDLAYFDEATSGWINEDIEYTAYIGTDSRNCIENQVKFRYL